MPGRGSPRWTRLAAESYGPVIGALSMLLKANEEAGTIRAGLDPDDVLLMDGLRAGAPGPAR